MDDESHSPPARNQAILGLLFASVCLLTGLALGSLIAVVVGAVTLLMIGGYLFRLRNRVPSVPDRTRSQDDPEA